MVIDRQVAELAERAQDDVFARKLQDDSLTALRDEGYDDLATAVAREQARIETLIVQLEEDEEFRARVETDPTRTLVEWGLPEEAIGPVLEIIGAPDDVIRRASGDVDLHGRRAVPAAAAAVVLGALAFAQASSAASPSASNAEAVRHRSSPPPIVTGGRWSPDPRRHGVRVRQRNAVTAFLHRVK
jgi:hypothetical protein